MTGEPIMRLRLLRSLSDEVRFKGIDNSLKGLEAKYRGLPSCCTIHRDPIPSSDLEHDEWEFYIRCEAPCP
jgi:hypothetical protein